MLTDYRTLWAKFEAAGLEVLLAEFDLVLAEKRETSPSEWEMFGLIRSALWMSREVLSTHPDLLGQQLVGRLMGWRAAHPAIRALTDEIMATVPGLYPVNPDSGYSVLEQAGVLPLNLFSGHGKWVTSLAISRDGQRLISASTTEVILWDVETGKHLMTFDGGYCAAFSPDGQRVAFGVDTAIEVWDIENQCRVFSLGSFKEFPAQVEFSSDGQSILARDFYRLYLWDANNGEVIRLLNDDFDLSDVSLTSACFSPDGRHIAMWGYNFGLGVWETKIGKIVFNVAIKIDYVFKLCYNPDGQKIAVATSENCLLIVDSQMGEENIYLYGLYHSDAIFSPDGLSVTAAGQNGMIWVWEIETKRLLFTLGNHAAFINKIVYSPTGDQIFSAAEDGTIGVWDTRILSRIHSFENEREPNDLCLFSHDGRYGLSVPMMYGFIRLWDVQSGTLLEKIPNSEYTIDLEQIYHDFPNFRPLEQHNKASVREKNGWRVEYQGNKVTIFSPDKEQQGYFCADGQLNCCDISPDGQTVIACDSDGRVMVLRLKI